MHLIENTSDIRRITGAHLETALLAPRGQVTDLLASQDENEGETSPIGKALLERKRCASEGGGAHRGADAGNTLGAGRWKSV